ncbi:MAG: hypothetical protein QXK73_05830 [Candidatus Bathyarchaeia archaeon]
MFISLFWLIYSGNVCCSRVRKLEGLKKAFDEICGRGFKVKLTGLCLAGDYSKAERILG